MYNMPDDYIESYTDRDMPNHYDYLEAQEKIAKIHGMLDEMINDLGDSGYAEMMVSQLRRMRKILEG